ncbi:MAG: hypothetical protein ACKO72_08430 [Actinomycetes bacterium]
MAGGEEFQNLAFARVERASIDEMLDARVESRLILDRAGPARRHHEDEFDPRHHPLRFEERDTRQLDHEHPSVGAPEGARAGHDLTTVEQPAPDDCAAP